MEAHVRANSAEQRLRNAIEGMLDVYSIPAAMRKILKVVDDENASNTDLVGVVQQDPALASRVLATANSAYYGFSRKISCLDSAVGVLGFEMVRNLAVSLSVFKPDSVIDCEYQNNLWHHSFEVARVASMVAEKTGAVQTRDAYLAGLIHDLGRAILYQVHGKKYVKVFNNGLDGLLEREASIFGANHSQVGAWFIDKYNFPKECVLALEFHHEPMAAPLDENETARDLTSVVYLADCIVFEAAGTERTDVAISQGHGEVLRRLDLDENAVYEILAEFDALGDTFKELYSSVG